VAAATVGLLGISGWWWLFLLTPSPRYWFDLDLIREPVNPANQCRGQSADPSHQPVNGVSNRIGAPTCSR
jgi:hypothetical protein